jgi:hypothetical protein
MLEHGGDVALLLASSIPLIMVVKAHLNPLWQQ